MNEDKMPSDPFWNTHKTCGELLCEECDDRFQKLHIELASKQKEIDKLQIEVTLLYAELGMEMK